MLKEEEYEVLHYVLMYEWPELIHFDKDSNIRAVVWGKDRPFKTVKFKYSMGKEEYIQKLTEQVKQEIEIALNQMSHYRKKPNPNKPPGPIAYKLWII